MNPAHESLQRETYAKLPYGVEKGNIAWKLLKPLYGLSTACKDWCETIRDFLAEVCGAHVTQWINRYSFGLNKGLAMGMVCVYVGFRCTDTENLDRCIFKVDGNFETGDKRTVLGP